jgi:hypothetical protein
MGILGGLLDGFTDAMVTPQAVGQKMGEYFTKNGVTAQALREAIAAGRSIVAEAARSLPVSDMPAATRERVLAWGPKEYAGILWGLKPTHPEHYAVLYESTAFYRYLVPEMDRAKAIIRAAAPPSAG